jgi:rod shape-determining protein MreD
MRRRILMLTLLVYAACLFQSTVFGYIEILRIRPNLLIVLAVSISLVRENMEAAFMGLVCGLAMDTLIGRALGWYGMCLFLVCYAIGMINSKLYKENPLIPVSFVFVSSLTVELMYYFINFFLKGYQDFGFVTTNIILPESLYNSVLTLFIYPLVLHLYKKLDKYDFIHTRL